MPWACQASQSKNTMFTQPRDFIARFPSFQTAYSGQTPPILELGLDLGVQEPELQFHSHQQPTVYYINAKCFHLESFSGLYAGDSLLVRSCCIVWRKSLLPTLWPICPLCGGGRAGTWRNLWRWRGWRTWRRRKWGRRHDYVMRIIAEGLWTGTSSKTRGNLVRARHELEAML